MAKMQYLGTGRRKASVARVRLIPGTGKITINKRSLDEFFGMEMVKREIERPFAVAGCEGKYDVVATVRGGGFSGQAGALRHGISRALCQADKEAYRPAVQQEIIYLLSFKSLPNPKTYVLGFFRAKFAQGVEWLTLSYNPSLYLNIKV